MTISFSVHCVELWNDRESQYLAQVNISSIGFIGKENTGMNNPLVSIACITYNHEKYIRDAIEGFLSQKTSFEYEIIIHDDASTDRTAEIVREYEAKYPDKIHGIYQKENQYNKGSIGITKTYVYPVCKGKYIALCEGDDFWIDINKLQLQADYMESHPECVVTCHDAVCVDYGDMTIYPLHPYIEERYLSEEEIIIQYHGDFPTASTMYRKDVFNVADWFMQSGVGDYSHELYAITKGKIYFLPRIMSIYRFRHEGSWSRTQNTDIEKRLLGNAKMIKFLRQYDEYTERKYHYAIVYRELLILLDSLYRCNDFNTGEMKKLVQQCNKKTANQYEKFFIQLEEVYKQTYEQNYYPISMKEFIKEYTHIYIWGAGKYGQRVANQLIHNNEDFEAFIVSKPDKQEVMGKAVIGMEDISYPMESVGIIVAVNVHNWDKLRERFEKNGDINYIYPYGVTEII